MKSKPGIWLGAAAAMCVRAEPIGRMSIGIAFPWRHRRGLVWCAPGRIKSPDPRIGRVGTLALVCLNAGLWRPLSRFVACLTLYDRGFLGVAATRCAFLKTTANVAGRG